MGFLSNLQKGIGVRVARFVARYQEQPYPERYPGPTETGLVDADLVNWTGRQWRVSQSREQRHQIRVRMDSDALISKALDVIADVATAPQSEQDARASFELSCANAKVRDAVEGLVDVVNLRRNSWGIARRLAKYGNEFREPVPDAGIGRIVRFKLLPEHQMWRREDEFGNPEDPPWEQRTYVQPDGTGRAFAEWQVVHYSYPEDEENTYGIGTLDCEREWMRWEAVLDDLVLARRTRSMDRFIHPVAVPKAASEAEARMYLRKYQDSLSRRRILSATAGSSSRDNPSSVISDFYVPYRGEEDRYARPELISPQNVQLQNIRDVELLRALILARLGVPMRYLNLGGTEAVRASIGIGGLNYEDIQFARTIRQLQSVLAVGHDQVISLHLVLRGMNPIENPVGIHFPLISMSDARAEADVEFRKAQALQIVSGIVGVPPDMIWDHYVGLSTAEKDRWTGNVTELAQHRVTQTRERTKRLEEIAAATLMMAHKELERDGDLHPGDDTGIAVSHRHGEPYPGPAFAN